MTTSTATLTFVTRTDDDLPCPTVGRVIGWEDEDRCLVVWGDAALSRTPEHDAQARVEWADELAPRRHA